MHKAHPRIAVLLIFAFMLHSTACTRGKPRVPPGTTAFDGETLYRGLIFRRGPAAEQVPELWRLLESAPRPPKEDSMERLRTSAAAILEAGDEQAAEALNKIADAAEEGRIPPRPPTQPVSDATVDATIAAIKTADSNFFGRFATNVQSGDPVRVQRAMTEASGLSMQILSDRVISGEQSLAVDVWYYWDIVVAVEIAAVLILALVAVFPVAATDNNLLRDDVVEIVTERFYVAAGQEIGGA